MHKDIDSLIVKPVVRMNASFGMIIPKNWVLAHGINPGDLLEMRIKSDRIVVSIPEGETNNH